MSSIADVKILFGIQPIDAGDHIIFIGQIIDIKKQDKEPMLYFRRNVGLIPAGWPV
ncbi:hypothetical protein GNT69_21205 [Bacillus sp. B15-48]|nr:hypothetical protein [Bacillus sp. B15-48]